MPSDTNTPESSRRPTATGVGIGDHAPADPLAALRALADNPINLPRLIEQLQNRIGVVPFVGAGMSVPFKLPAWRPFLESQAPDASIRQQIQALLDQGHYEEAAEALLTAKGNNAFQSALDDTFGAHRLPQSLPPAAILHLPRLCAGPILTTNFDPVLETVFAQAGQPFADRILGMKVDAVSTAFHQSRRVLVKLHGDAADRTDRVLTFSDYERAYGEREPLAAVLRFAMTRPLLFLGCSLGQDRTVRVLEQLIRELRQQHAEGLQMHYAILERPAQDAEFAARNRRLADLGIRPIWYPTKQHDLLEPLLAHLAAEVESAQSAPPRRLEMPAEQLPYLCDRSTQEEEFRALFDQLHSRPEKFRRPILCVVHGAMGEAHREFLDRLETRFLPRHLTGLGITGQIKFVHFTQCPTAADATGFGQQLRRWLAADLNLGNCGDDPQLLAGCKSRRVRLLAPTLNLTHREAFTTTRDCLRLAHDYWADFPDLPPDLVLIAFVSIKHVPEPLSAKPGMLRSLFSFATKTPPPPVDPRERIRAFDRRPIAADARVICAALPELESVRFEDVNAWSQSAEVTAHFSRRLRDDQLQAIFRDQPARPMQTVIDELDKLIAAQRS